MSCLGGALLLEDYLALVRGAGFRDVEVVAEDPFPISSGSNRATLEAVHACCGVPVDEVAAAEGIALSAKVLARKPDGEPSPKRKPRVKRSGRR